MSIPPKESLLPQSIFAMSNAQSEKKHEQSKPSPSAQILSNVEMLDALCEEQERAAKTVEAPADTNAIEQAVKTSVEEAVNDNLAKVVETAVSEALSTSVKTVLHECFSRFEKRITKFDDRINQVDDQLNKLDTNVQSFNARFDSLNEKIDSPKQNGSRNIKTESQLEHQLNMIGSDLADVILKFDDKFASLERTFEDQCKTVNGFYAQLNADGGLEANAAFAPNANLCDALLAKSDIEKSEATSIANDSDSDWQKQKNAILAQYDAAPEDPTTANTIADASIEKSAEATNGVTTENATEGPIESVDSSEVEQLKLALNAKLREAEVELSINRARLSQERAVFERNQAELNRRSAALEAKLAATSSNDGTADNSAADYMTRIKRHLGN